MIVPLTKALFENETARIPYGGNKEAELLIIDEAFPGSDAIGVVTMVAVFVRQKDDAGNTVSLTRCTNIIGLGDGVAGIRTDVPELLGKVLTGDNMEQCSLELVE